MAPEESKFFVSNKIKLWALWIISALLFGYFLIFIIDKSDKPTHGFASYFTASKLLAEGKNVSNFYNDKWFSNEVEKNVPGIYEIYHVNPPTTALLFLPLSKFDYITARITLTIFNLILLIITFLIIVKSLNLSGKWIPVGIIITLCFQPLYANFAYAQAYVLIFFLLVLSWQAYIINNEKLLGVLLGGMLIIKTAGVILFILLLVQKKWRGIIYGVTSVVLLFLITLPFVGFNSWIVYFQTLINYSASPELSVTAYQAIHSFFYHLTFFDPVWNPHPVIDYPFLGETFTISFSFILLAFSIYFALKNKMPGLMFGIFVLAGIILNPASIDYHFVIVLLPVLIFMKIITNNKSIITWILFLLFYLLLALPIPYTSAKITYGWLAVFAYPKLYGTLGFIVLIFVSMIKSARLVIEPQKVNSL